MHQTFHEACCKQISIALGTSVRTMSHNNKFCITLGMPMCTVFCTLGMAMCTVICKRKRNADAVVNGREAGQGCAPVLITRTRHGHVLSKREDRHFVHQLSHEACCKQISVALGMALSTASRNQIGVALGMALCTTT